MINIWPTKFSRLSPIKRHQRKTILVIAFSWTLADTMFFFWRKGIGILPEKYYNPETNLTQEIMIREITVFLISLFLGYFLVSVLRNYLRDVSLWYNLMIKTLLLLGVAFVMTFLIYISYEWLIAGNSFVGALKKFIYNLLHRRLLLEKMPEWLLLFLITQLAIEVNEKYSPGVFFNIIIGRYLQPREERRIILFLDLKDSTPIAEKLGHKEYFKFIRDFIFYISSGFIDNNGRIYQYVGDEVVVWWPESKENALKAINSLLSSRKALNQKQDRFKRRYGVMPEYKAGIHTGLVTVGQVGIIKKDLVMSGDTINTAARIRSACTDMNQKYLISKDVLDFLDMKEWQAEPMIPIDLKGKNQQMELFALKI
ncbi:MAG: adenylate/guanylate cyclase domain-containing protein [Chitinophagaceae bacterium]|nr:adenylate/guanylate cyclase domain-containing protein [Chitinophagaceae bacterium]